MELALTRPHSSDPMTVVRCCVTVSIWFTDGKSAGTQEPRRARLVPLRRSYVGGQLAAPALSCRCQSLLSSAYSTTSR